jgi:hypothetical protein
MIMNDEARRSREPHLERVLVPPGRLVVAAMLALAAMSALIVLSWLVATIAHVDDGHGVDHVSGTWMALAAYANSGTLYPPLYDGQVFGGTRFMPVPILLQAAAARVSGEYLVSAKALSSTLVAVLVTFVFLLLRRRCPTPVALMLASTILATGTGLTAAASVRNDVLPVLLQLAAVALVSRSLTRATITSSALLCALAVLSKASALWAPLAIGAWLLGRERHKLAAFAGSFGAAVALGLVAFQLASDGRMVENVLGLSVATAERLGSLHDELARLRLIGREGLGPLAVLLLLAVVGTVVAARRRELTPYHVAFTCAAIVTAIVLLDPGAFVNHLLDVQVLSVLVVGELWRRTSPGRGSLSVTSAAVVVALLAASPAAYHENVALGRDVETLLHGTKAPDRVPRLADSVGAGESVLSEDPFVPVSRGQRPVVLDPFMLLSIASRHPRWRTDLIRRIESAEFEKVVLFYQPESAPLWYRTRHFGEEIVRAIDRSYRPAERVGGYWVYVPRGAGG